MRASAIESRPSAARVKLPVYNEMDISVTPIANRVHIESQAAFLPSWNAVDGEGFFNNLLGIYNTGWIYYVLLLSKINDKILFYYIYRVINQQDSFTISKKDTNDMWS